MPQQQILPPSLLRASGSFAADTVFDSDGKIVPAVFIDGRSLGVLSRWLLGKGPQTLVKQVFEVLKRRFLGVIRLVCRKFFNCLIQDLQIKLGYRVLRNFGLTRSHLVREIFAWRGKGLYGGGLAVMMLRVGSQQAECTLLITAWLVRFDGMIRMTRWLISIHLISVLMIIKILRGGCN